MPDTRGIGGSHPLSSSRESANHRFLSSGRGNVVAGTDCGLGGRVHANLAWAKLRALVEGARLASTSLWP
jgi:methionine synthase II (cobalamin-independent)